MKAKVITYGCTTQMLYSVADVCQLVVVTRQSVVQRLKEHKIVSSMDKIGNKYALTQIQLERLLFLSYPKAYYVFTGKEGSSMDIIPTSIGKKTSFRVL